MCGIAGAFDPERLRAEAMVVAMNGQMHARGPDDEGVWSAQAGLGDWLTLGSRRLAIIDTSHLGHQPMVDEATGVAIVYNGMTYNFKSLRSTLESDGASFRSTSDTEVVLRLYIERGMDAIAALDGMFGVAIWDPRSESLLLARDRLGIKPLYFTRPGGRFVFASQVRAILASGATPMRPSLAGIRDYLATGAAVDPTTVIEGITAVRPGETLIVRNGQVEQSVFWRPSWSVRDVPWHRAVSGFREVLDAAVRSHLISDVPTSVFLSGGLDSSVIVGLAAKHSPNIHSLSVVFAEHAFNEGPFSRVVAQNTGTQHHEVTLAASDLTSMLPDVFAAMDQPTVDGVNTYVVAVAARHAGLKVSLSGLGADELLDGYGLARRARLLTKVGHLPRSIRGLLPVRLMNSANSSHDKLRAWMAQPGDSNQAHQLLRSLFPPDQVRRLMPASTSARGPDRASLHEDPRWANDLAWLEMRTYLRNVLLRDTDCMCMANSVELRVPYLDNGVVDFVLSLPPAVRSRRKQLIEEAFRDVVPPEVIGRRKQGFTLPIGPWMESTLRDVVAERLNEPPDALRPLFESRSVQSVWDAFQATGGRWLQPWSLYALFTWWASAEAETRSSQRPN